MIRWVKIFLFQARPLNLFIAFLSFAYASYFASERSTIFLNDPLFYKEVFIILILMATGYWTNDAFDIKTDLLKNPKKNLLRSRKEAIGILIVSQIIALGGIFYGWFSPLPFAAKWINTLAYVLLFFYSSFLKRRSPMGNIVIALLAALTLFIPNILYAYRFENIWLIIFSFWITLIREITKDLEDLEADFQAGRQTLPILFGKKRTETLLLVLYAIFFFWTFSPFVHYYIFKGIFLWEYLIFIVLLVNIPLGYNVYSMLKGTSDYSLQSLLLKAVIFGGFFAIYFL